MLMFGATPEMTMEGRIELAMRHNCVMCKRPFVWHGSGKEKHLRKRGDIYSDLGRQEIAISGLCKYCFDRMLGIY